MEPVVLGEGAITLMDIAKAGARVLVTMAGRELLMKKFPLGKRG